MNNVFKKSLTLAGLITSLSFSGFSQSDIKGRAVVTPDKFEFPAYAEVNLYHPKDTTKTYFFKADHMGVIHYELPSDSLEMKINGHTTYLGFVNPGDAYDADAFTPFKTKLVLNDVNLKALKPLQEKYGFKNK